MRWKEKTEMERRRWKEQVGRKDRKADNKNEKERDRKRHGLSRKEKRKEGKDRKQRIGKAKKGKTEKEGWKE